MILLIILLNMFDLDAPLFDVLEETALYRLKCIMEKTDQLNTQVKRDQNQMSISSFPAKCEKSSTAAKQRPLKSSYPERNFQRYCTDNVVLKKPDFVTLGHIKPHIFLGQYTLNILCYSLEN